jgi:signal transduction histidine kinase
LKNQFWDISKKTRIFRSFFNALEQYSPGYILVFTIISVVFAEVIAMSLMYYFQFLPYFVQTLLDVVVMTVIISPLLYLLSFRPLLQNIQQKRRFESITQARLRLMQFANTHSLNELLQYSLDEIESLTGSSIGFFHFLDADQNGLWLQAWSTNTLQKMCSAEGKGSHYNVDQAGVWADCIRMRQVVIHNDISSLMTLKGKPEGHASVIREIVVPVFRKEKIVAILGVGNKPQDYTEKDAELVSALADYSWDITERKQAEAENMTLHQKEEILSQSIRTIQTNIARDLHDTLGQNNSFLRMTLEHLSETKEWDQVQSQKQIQNMVKVANESFELIRTMLVVLQPADPVDPLNLFIQYAEQVSERSSFRVVISSQGNPRLLSPQQGRQLFNIFREALSNIEKYAYPGQVSVNINWAENGLSLKISDDGTGFEIEQVKTSGHYGLQIMRERTLQLNGSFLMQSTPGKGTTILVEVPYEEGALSNSLA